MHHQQQLLLLMRQMQLIQGPGDQPIRVGLFFGAANHVNELANAPLLIESEFGAGWQLREAALISKKPSRAIAVFLPMADLDKYRKWETIADHMGKELRMWPELNERLGLLSGSMRWIGSLFFRQKISSKNMAARLDYLRTGKTSDYERMLDAGCSAIIDDAVTESIALVGRLTATEEYSEPIAKGKIAKNLKIDIGTLKRRIDRGEICVKDVTHRTMRIRKSDYLG